MIAAAADVLAKPFATTVTGEILIPLIVFLLGTLLVGGARYARKILRQAAANNSELQTIRRETQTNSGSSLRDAVVRIEARLGNVDSKIDQHLADSAMNLDRLNRHLDHNGPERRSDLWEHR